MEPPNKGQFRITLFIGRRLSSLGVLKSMRTIQGRCILGPEVLSFVERFIVLCPY